jgi:hypothetical protein
MSVRAGSVERGAVQRQRWGRHTRTSGELEGRRSDRTCASITHVEAGFRPSSNEGIELKSRVFFDTPLLRHVFLSSSLRREGNRSCAISSRREVQVGMENQ